MNIELKELFDKALNDGINMFLGAGFALDANDIEGTPLPLGSQLSLELSEQFSTPNLDLPKVAAIIENKNKAGLLSFLINRFSVGNFNPKYHNIENANIKSIYTTNIDNLIYKVLDKSERHYINDTSTQGPSFKERKAIDYYPLHGTIVNTDKPLVFTPMAIASSYSKSPKLWEDLLRSIEKHPTIFWGYALNDSGVLEILDSVKTNFVEKNQKWIVLHKPNSQEEEYFKSIGFNIITATNIELLDYLGNINTGKTDSKKRKTTKELFGRDYIPSNPASLPVREINEFYTGAAPSWSDIFRPDLYKISHYATIQNSIFSNKNTIVIGIPGSGKTTLMMQLAAYTDFDGHKIIEEMLTPEKVQNILNTAKQDNVLIFVDNFTDDVQSFLQLHGKPNIKLIGIDREPNYEIIKHLIPYKEFNEVPVTELTSNDIQELYNRIPPSIRSRQLKTKKGGIETIEEPSLFEFINLNIRLSNINDRFRALLDSLEDKDPLLSEFLVLSSYVHSCRTPLSFDMAFSFFSDDISSYHDIYDLRDTLGQLLTDSPLSMIEDEDQDYFSNRSQLLAEVILEVVNSSLLRRVLNKFIDRLPSYKIVGFKTFRKRAHDKFIMIKAFPNWLEGKTYYERLMLEDPKNPFLLQQGALYLSNKQKYSDAFYWIDKARNMTNDSYLSIRNSHAIILFDANIKKDGPDVKQSLDKSMSILQDCYSEDKRKLYHAKKYAEQAIEYYYKYSDNVSNEYLTQAAKWIEEEISINNWDKSLKNLLRSLKSCMLSFK